MLKRRESQVKTSNCVQPRMVPYRGWGWVILLHERKRVFDGDKLPEVTS